MGDVLCADACRSLRAEKAGSWRVLAENHGRLAAALPDGDHTVSLNRGNVEAREALMLKEPRFAVF